MYFSLFCASTVLSTAFVAEPRLKPFAAVIAGINAFIFTAPAPAEKYLCISEKNSSAAEKNTFGSTFSAVILVEYFKRSLLDFIPVNTSFTSVKHFSVSGAAISRHLSVLKEADLVYDSREGKYIYYTINTSVLEETLLWIADLKGE